MRKAIFVLALSVSNGVAVLWISALPQTVPPAFSYRQVMIPMRDGIRLQTVILTPANATEPLPILFRRTPYGVPSNGDLRLR